MNLNDNKRFLRFFPQHIYILSLKFYPSNISFSLRITLNFITKFRQGIEFSIFYDNSRG